jgi:hypothetical protein
MIDLSRSLTTSGYRRRAAPACRRTGRRRLPLWMLAVDVVGGPHRPAHPAAAHALNEILVVFSMEITLSKEPAFPRLRLGMVRGTPSQDEILRTQSGSARRFADTPMMNLIRTACRVHILLGFQPYRVPSFLTAARRMLPVEMVGMESSLTASRPWSFPAPEGPKESASY